MIVYAVAAGVLLVVEVVLGVYLIGRSVVEWWRERGRFDGQGRERVGISNRRVP